jgi:NADH:ubiquinone oxidoreductase subunit E
MSVEKILSVYVCFNETCKEQNSMAVYNTLKRKFDGKYYINKSECLGMCGNGPNYEIEFPSGNRSDTISTLNSKDVIGDIEKIIEQNV